MGLKNLVVSQKHQVTIKPHSCQLLNLFMISQINREEPLVIEDDKKQYTKTEMQGILNGDDNGGGNSRKTRAMQLRKTLMAFGLLGFVKFTQV